MCNIPSGVFVVPISGWSSRCTKNSTSAQYFEKTPASFVLYLFVCPFDCKLHGEYGSYLSLGVGTSHVSNCLQNFSLDQFARHRDLQTFIFNSPLCLLQCQLFLLTPKETNCIHRKPIHYYQYMLRSGVRIVSGPNISTATKLKLVRGTNAA